MEDKICLLFFQREGKRLEEGGRGGRIQRDSRENRQRGRDGMGLLLYGRACRRIQGSTNRRAAIYNAYQVTSFFIDRVLVERK